VEVKLAIGVSEVGERVAVGTAGVFEAAGVCVALGCACAVNKALAVSAAAVNTAWGCGVGLTWGASPRQAIRRTGKSSKANPLQRL